MKTFFLTFRVIPTLDNEHYNLVKGGLASCWVLETDPESAYSKAEFFVSKQDWKIKKVETLPVEVTKEHFRDRDIGLQQYLRAQEEGIAIIYVACARDGKTSAGPLPIRPSYIFPLFPFLKRQKQLTNKGRCLHYDSGHRCKEII